jgi:hypothetical protein
VEDFSSTLGIEVGYLAGRFSFRESTAQDTSGRGAGHEVKESACRFPGFLLDALKKSGGNDSPDATTIHAQNADNLVCHSGFLPLTSQLQHD